LLEMPLSSKFSKTGKKSMSDRAVLWTWERIHERTAEIFKSGLNAKESFELLTRSEKINIMPREYYAATRRWPNERRNAPVNRRIHPN